MALQDIYHDKKMLPEHLLLYLNDQILCREQQIRQLAGLINPDILGLSTIVLHGTTATGKSLTVRQVLDAVGVSHAIVSSKECITGRHLLERTVISCKTELEKVGAGPFNDIDGRCESLNTLVVLLQRMLEDPKKFVLVYDGIDRQREAAPFLLPGLARLGEIIPNLTIVMVVTAPRPRFLRLAGVPHIHFLPYDRTESLAIVSQHPLSVSDDPSATNGYVQQNEKTDEESAVLWKRFCGAVWDSLGRGAARNVVSLRRLCERLWPQFISPIKLEGYSTKSFSQLMVRNRPLFQNTAVMAELHLRPLLASENTKRPNRGTISHLIQFYSPGYTISELLPTFTDNVCIDTIAFQDLSYYTKYLILSAYLASYNPSRQDQTFSSQLHEKKKKRRPRKAPSTSGGRPQKHRRIQRKLLGPQPFILERLLAIFHAIIPHEAPAGSADVLTQVATLASLRMIARVSGGGVVADTAGGGMDAGARWKVNVGWEYVKGIAKTLRFEIEEFMAE